MGKTIKGVTLLLISVLFLLSCVSSGTPFSNEDIPPNKAIIYIYRPAKFSLSLRAIYMEFSGNPDVYAMTNSGYFPLIADPGTIKLTGVGTDFNPVEFILTVRTGEVHYIKVSFDESSLTLGVPVKFELVGSEQGFQEIKECSRISKAE